MLRFSEHNKNYREKKEVLLDELIVSEMKSGNPNWDKINTLLNDKNHLQSMQDFYATDKDFATETYEQWHEESLMDDVSSFNNNETIVASKCTLFPATDFEDPFCSLKEKLGNSLVNSSINLIKLIKPGILNDIVHIGIKEDGEELGEFDPEYDAMIKDIYYRNQNLSEEDLIEKQKERKGISILINPYNIEKEAVKLCNKNCNENDLNQLKQVVLADIIVHEITHLNGNNGEEVPQTEEKNFLSKALDIINKKRKNNLPVCIKK